MWHQEKIKFSICMKWSWPVTMLNSNECGRVLKILSQFAFSYEISEWKLMIIYECYKICRIIILIKLLSYFCMKISNHSRKTLLSHWSAYDALLRVYTTYMNPLWLTVCVPYWKTFRSKTQVPADDQKRVLHATTV